MARHSLDVTSDYRRDLEESYAIVRGGYIRSNTWRARRAAPTLLTTIKNVAAMRLWLATVIITKGVKK